MVNKHRSVIYKHKWKERAFKNAIPTGSAEKDWIGCLSKGVLWNIPIYLPVCFTSRWQKILQASVLKQWWSEMIWRWTTLFPPTISVLQSWWWEHEMKSGALTTAWGCLPLWPPECEWEAEQWFSSPATQAIFYKVISLPLAFWAEKLFCMCNAWLGMVKLVRANWRAGTVPETKIYVLF